MPIDYYWMTSSKYIFSIPTISFIIIIDLRFIYLYFFLFLLHLCIIPLYKIFELRITIDLFLLVIKFIFIIHFEWF